MRLIFFLVVLGPLALAQAQPALKNRVNLEDVGIQGEANRGQALFQNRDRFSLDDRIQIRKSFRAELEEAIPASFKRLPHAWIKEPASNSAPQ